MTRIKENALLVYVSGPFTNDDPEIVEQNILEACRIGSLIMLAGHAPFIPHLLHEFHKVYPQDYEDWLAVDLIALRRCDMVFRIPGISKGADIEVAEAIKREIPVFYSEKELLDELQRREFEEGVDVCGCDD